MCLCLFCGFCFFFFKQKTAYEMRISDWSSDVCSSDLLSLFGPSFMTRLVTQMYFQGDPLLPLDPIFNCVTDQRARDSMIATFDLETTVPEFAQIGRASCRERVCQYV